MTLALLLSWLLAILSLPAAQDSDLALTARAGFDGLVGESSAVPLVVTARNNGAPFEGEVRVMASDSIAGNPLVYSAPISLPTGSDKRVPLVIHIPPFGGGLTVQLVEQEQVVAEVETGQLTQVGQDELFYGVASSDPGGLAFLETISGGRTDSAVAFLDPEDLPEVSSAWAALDILVLDDIDTSRMSAGQTAALRIWVENGGQLVVTGGPGGPQTAVGVADLLPVIVNGVATIDSLPALAEFAGDPIDAPGPFVVTESNSLRGKTLIHQNDLPLLVREELGRGSVTFLALDPKLEPLTGWAGHDSLWEAIAAETPSPAPWGTGIRDGYAATSAVSYIPGLRLPSIVQLIFFLVLYTAIIGPINFLILRRFNRRELAWVTIPALVLLFSAATFLTGFRTRGNTASLNKMSVAYGSIDAERVWTQTALGLYSPRRDRYNIILPYNSTAYPFNEGFGSILGSSNLDTITRSSDLTLSGVRTDTSEVAPFIVEADLPRPPLSATAILSPGGNEIEVTVKNSGNETLENAVLIYGQDQLGLGNIGAGEEQSIRLLLTAGTTEAPVPSPDPLFSPGIAIPNPLTNDPSAILGTMDYYNDPIAYPRWQLIQSLYGGDPNAPAELPNPRKMVTLGGWLPGSAQSVKVTDGNVTQTGETLILLEIPVR